MAKWKKWLIGIKKQIDFGKGQKENIPDLPEEDKGTRIQREGGSGEQDEERDTQ